MDSNQHKFTQQEVFSLIDKKETKQALNLTRKAISNEKSKSSFPSDAFLEFISAVFKKLSEEANNLTQADETASSIPIFKELLNLSAKFKTTEILQQRIEVLNNIACAYRKVGKIHSAKKSIARALELAKQDTQGKLKLASTYLNMCAVLSSLKKHKEAQEFAKRAVQAAQEDLLEAKLENSQETSQKVAVLGIAYHNLAIELEFLNKKSEALQWHSKAYKFMNKHATEEQSQLLKDFETSYQKLLKETSRPQRPFSASSPKKLPSKSTTKSLKAVSSRNLRPTSSKPKHNKPKPKLPNFDTRYPLESKPSTFEDIRRNYLKQEFLNKSKIANVVCQDDTQEDIKELDEMGFLDISKEKINTSSLSNISRYSFVKPTHSPLPKARKSPAKENVNTPVRHFINCTPSKSTPEIETFSFKPAQTKSQVQISVEKPPPPPKKKTEFQVKVTKIQALTKGFLARRDYKALKNSKNKILASGGRKLGTERFFILVATWSDQYYKVTAKSSAQELACFVPAGLNPQLIINSLQTHKSFLFYTGEETQSHPGFINCLESVISGKKCLVSYYGLRNYQNILVKAHKYLENQTLSLSVNYKGSSCKTAINQYIFTHLHSYLVFQNNTLKLNDPSNFTTSLSYYIGSQLYENTCVFSGEPPKVQVEATCLEAQLNYKTEFHLSQVLNKLSMNLTDYLNQPELVFLCLSFDKASIKLKATPVTLLAESTKKDDQVTFNLKLYEMENNFLVTGVSEQGVRVLPLAIPKTNSSTAFGTLDSVKVANSQLIFVLEKHQSNLVRSSVLKIQKAFRNFKKSQALKLYSLKFRKSKTLISRKGNIINQEPYIVSAFSTPQGVLVEFVSLNTKATSTSFVSSLQELENMIQKASASNQKLPASNSEPTKTHETNLTNKTLCLSGTTYDAEAELLPDKSIKVILFSLSEGSEHYIRVFSEKEVLKQVGTLSCEKLLSKLTIQSNTLVLSSETPKKKSSSKIFTTSKTVKNTLYLVSVSLDKFGNSVSPNDSLVVKVKQDSSSAKTLKIPLKEVCELTGFDYKSTYPMANYFVKHALRITEERNSFKLGVQSLDPLDKIIKIQAVYRGFITRKHLSEKSINKRLCKFESTISGKKYTVVAYRTNDSVLIKAIKGIQVLELKLGPNTLKVIEAQPNKAKYIKKSIVPNLQVIEEDSQKRLVKKPTLGGSRINSASSSISRMSQKLKLYSPTSLTSLVHKPSQVKPQATKLVWRATCCVSKEEVLISVYDHNPSYFIEVLTNFQAEPLTAQVEKSVLRDPSEVCDIISLNQERNKIVLKL